MANGGVATARRDGSVVIVDIEILHCSPDLFTPGVILSAADLQLNLWLWWTTFEPRSIVVPANDRRPLPFPNQAEVNRVQEG